MLLLSPGFLQLRGSVVDDLVLAPEFEQFVRFRNQFAEQVGLTLGAQRRTEQGFSEIAALFEDGLATLDEPSVIDAVKLGEELLVETWQQLAQSIVANGLLGLGAEQGVLVALAPHAGDFLTTRGLEYTTHPKLLVVVDKVVRRTGVDAK